MEKPGEREEVDLSPLFEDGLLEEESLHGLRETALFVELSSSMDEGEAEAAALSISRGYSLVTDDRKVRRTMAEKYHSLEVVGKIRTPK